MAHRIYIYNIDRQTNQIFGEYLGEWNYVIPDLLLPLLSANVRAKGKALYFDKEVGVRRLRQFYDLLAETYQLQDEQAFVAPVTLMFEFLNDLPYDTFYMDASDVYNMNEEKPKEQAKQWVEEIKEKWDLYQKALDTNNLNVLDESIRASGYSSWLEALAHDWVNYGLGYWEEHSTKQTRSVVFHEGCLQGLKDKKGNILAPAIYDVIYAFTDVYVAVVEKEGKFGYLNDQGKLIVPLLYDEAFDAYAVNHIKVGIVCVGKKKGLLHIDTQQWGILPMYDEVEQLYDQYYNVSQDGRYQLLDYTGKRIIQESSEAVFELDYPLKFFTRRQGTAKRKYYTSKGQYLGEYPENVLEELPLDFYWVKPNKFQTKILVLNPKGETILTEIDQILALSNYTSFAYKINKQWKLYDCQTQSHRLSTYEIVKIHANYLCNYVQDVYVIQTTVGGGFYKTTSDSWLIEPQVNNLKIEHLNGELIKLTQKEGVRYYNMETEEQSESYTYICEPIDFHSQKACLFQGDTLYYLDLEGNRIAVSPMQLGQLYEQRYNLRGKDLIFFTAFYEAWIARMGEHHEEYFDLDTLYHRGIAARENEDWLSVIKYFTIGANRNDPRMLYELGVLYTEENAWTDLAQGIAYLEAAAKQDYADAWNTLGYLYQNAIGYSYNFELMIQAYERAVALGCIWANNNLGDLYFYGQHVEQDYDKALSYYVLSEKYYGSYAQNLIEIHYQRGDFNQVVKYLKRNKYQPYVHIYYGILYDHGYGVKQSEKKAIEHYEQAIAYSTYYYAVERLLFYYKEHPKFQDAIQYQRIVDYANVNEMEL